MNKTYDLLFFNNLFTNYRSRYIAYANTYLHDWTIAEDLTSEAFITFWENKETLKPDSNIQAYILTILKNKCLNHLNKKQSEIAVLSHLQDHISWELQLRITTLEASNPEELFSLELQQKIESAIAGLPEKTKQVFELSRLQQKSHKEISELLGISTKGVEFHITKSLTLLRKKLKEYLLLLILITFFHQIH